MNKTMKKIIGILVVAVLMVSFSFANGAEIYANKKNISVTEAYQQLKDNQSFASLAKAEGWLEEFKQAMIQEKENWANQQVSDKKWTEEEAKTWIENMKERISTCDGTRKNTSKMQAKQMKGQGYHQNNKMMQQRRGGQSGNCLRK